MTVQGLPAKTAVPARMVSPPIHASVQRATKEPTVRLTPVGDQPIENDLCMRILVYILLFG